MLSCQRDLFSLPDSLHYLNCAYVAPLLKSVEAAGTEGMLRLRNPTGITADDWFAPEDHLRALVGRLVNAPAERVALIPSVSYGIAIAARNLELRPGQNVVMPGEEFPSNVYSWMDKCRQIGAELRMVPRPPAGPQAGRAWNEKLLEAIDGNTAVVCLTELHWTDGTRFDLGSIGDRAREVGAAFLVDGTQSVGAAPFDFRATRPDLLVSASYKWCFGPYGFAFAVLGDRLLEGQPLEMTWTGRKGSEDFANLINYTEELRPGADRFDAGERASPILVPMLATALTQLLEWGVNNIQEYCDALVSELEMALGETEYAIAPREERAAHMFGIRVPDPSRLDRVMVELKKRDVHVSVRGASLRVSPHLYNRPEDMAALAEALMAARG